MTARILKRNTFKKVQSTPHPGPQYHRFRDWQKNGDSRKNIFGDLKMSGGIGRGEVNRGRYWRGGDYNMILKDEMKLVFKYL